MTGNNPTSSNTETVVQTNNIGTIIGAINEQDIHTTEMTTTVPDDGFLTEDESQPEEVPAENQEETVQQKENEQTSFRFKLPVYPNNAQQDYQVSQGQVSNLNVAINFAIPLPSHHISEIDEAVVKVGAEFIESTEGEDWATIALHSRHMHPRAAGAYRDAETGRTQVPSAMTGTVCREDAEFVQVVDTQRGKLGATKITSQPPAGKMTLTGQAAVNRIRSRIGMGDTVKIPLFHSGLWVSIKAPIEGDLIDFLRRLSQEKINLGRSTSGAIFSNLNVVVAEFYRNFIAEHVVETSYYNIDKVFSRILAPDLDHLVWGLACAVYPNGFDYARSVISPDDGQKKIIRDKINLSKIQWTDRHALSESQLNHMGNRANGSMSEASVTRYQEELFLRTNRNAVIEAENGTKIDIDLKIPTLDEYIEIGNEWLNSIIKMVDSTLGMNGTVDNGERAKAINEQGMASYLQMYSHWIEKIGVENEEVVEKETIGKILAAIGSNEQIRRSIVKEVTRFIDDSVVSLIALPALTDTEAAKLPAFPHLVPINVLHIFFILLVQKANGLPQDETI